MPDRLPGFGRIASPRCPECGHPEYVHFENVPSTRTKVGDPVPCYAHERRGDVSWPCGCRWALGETVTF